MKLSDFFSEIMTAQREFWRTGELVGGLARWLDTASKISLAKALPNPPPSLLEASYTGDQFITVSSPAPPKTIIPGLPPQWDLDHNGGKVKADKGPTPVVAMPKGDVRVVREKVKRAKTKWTKVTYETNVYEKQAMVSEGQVGGLARAQAALEKQGYGLFPASFNTLYTTSGDPFRAAVDGLQQMDATTYKLNTTKTFTFLHSDSSEIAWNAIKLANPKSSSICLPQDSDIPIMAQVGEGKTGSILPDAPVPNYNSKMSQKRKEELKSQKTAFNDATTYLKTWPKKQARTTESKGKCGWWGWRKRRKEKAKKEKEEMMAMKEKKTPWHERWRKKKEEKTRLAHEKEEEEMAREPAGKRDQKSLPKNILKLLLQKKKKKGSSKSRAKKGDRPSAGGAEKMHPFARVMISEESVKRKTKKEKKEAAEKIYKKGRAKIKQFIADKRQDKDETVRGTLPVFKLRSKADREKWQKLVNH